MCYRRCIAYLLPRFLPHFAVASHNELGELWRDGRVLFLAERNIFAHDLHVERVGGLRRVDVVLVDVGDVLGKAKVILAV